MAGVGGGGAEETMLTVRDVAKRLRLAEQTVYRMVSRGELPAIRVGKKGRGLSIRFDRGDMTRWETEHRMR